VEEALAAVWSEVLGISQVGRHDNFFELGGDSILSLQIVTKLRCAGWKITPRQLFERQAIAALAPVVTVAIAGVAAGSGRENENENRERMGPVPMLPIQLEFFEQDIPARHHWNQAVLLKSRNPLQRETLIQALESIVQHHDALRFRYAKQDGSGWEQSCSANPSKEVASELLWERQAQSIGQFEPICNEVQRSLNLVEGPLLRAALIDMADGAQRLLLVIHHLVIDGVSWRILLEDLQTAYRQGLSNTAVGLPEKSAAYGTWAKRLRGYIHEHADELTFWHRLADAQATLPSSISDGTNKLGERASIEVRLDSDLTHALLRQAPAAYRTQVNDLLLVALGSALCQWSGHEKILVDLEGHGREDLYEELDLSRTVGGFTCL
jgi:aryl carrier-like protein